MGQARGVRAAQRPSLGGRRPQRRRRGAREGRAYSPARRSRTREPDPRRRATSSRWRRPEPVLVPGWVANLGLETDRTPQRVCRAGRRAGARARLHGLSAARVRRRTMSGTAMKRAVIPAATPDAGFAAWAIVSRKSARPASRASHCGRRSKTKSFTRRTDATSGPTSRSGSPSPRRLDDEQTRGTRAGPERERGDDPRCRTVARA